LKTAIFGGTFDPVHCAHITVAREAATQFGMEQVLFVVAGNPPHKPGATHAPYEDRVRMVELACEGEPRFVPSRLEEGRERSYSIHTIQRVKTKQPNGDPLYFIIGADAFAEIESWYRWRDVMQLVEFIVVTRPGHEYHTPEGARVHRLDTLALPVSSTDLRKQLAEGASPSELPATVLDYIRMYHLYGA
jgi:nicotinate-nucleotide adenylyltransferase